MLQPQPTYARSSRIPSHTQQTEDRTLATRIILVRHGLSTYNLQRRVQGHCDDSTLSDEGKKTAQQAGEALQGLQFDAVYSSPLKRARETAEIICDQLDTPPTPQFTDLLKEINLAEWEGMTFAEVEEQFPEGFQIWRERPHELQMQRATDAGTESFFPVLDLREQARQFWEMVLPQHSGKTLLVVAHSGINRSLISVAADLPPDHYNVIHQTNCAISVLNFPNQLDDGVQLESVNLTSHLGMPLPKPREGHKGPRILLVRHGETDWNRDKRFQGQIDIPLNDSGRAQSDKAAAFLKDVAIDVAVTSPMLRPKETAEIILKHHPQITLETEPLLMEIAHGLWEGKLEAEIEADYAETLDQWKVAPEKVQMPEGENLQQVWDRAIAAWEKILANADTERPTTILVVAHDAINKALLCYLTGLEPKHFWSFKQGNGAVSVIDYPKGRDRRPMIQALNITTHFGSGVLDKTAAGAL